ncbi:hypothetical protein LXA43DRAFT_1068000 [Ganoderma leucocontextum]|nr:hypothetical protein LXA43DRAFT_1068000 [Ganoderma leucocontextum]
MVNLGCKTAGGSINNLSNMSKTNESIWELGALGNVRRNLHGFAPQSLRLVMGHTLMIIIWTSLSAVAATPDAASITGLKSEVAASSVASRILLTAVDTIEGVDEQCVHLGLSVARSAIRNLEVHVTGKVTRSSATHLEILALPVALEDVWLNEYEHTAGRTDGEVVGTGRRREKRERMGQTSSSRREVIIVSLAFLIVFVERPSPYGREVSLLRFDMTARRIGGGPDDVMDNSDEGDNSRSQPDEEGEYDGDG